jgi:hypothetical protein
MAAALADDVVLASPDLQGCDEVARLPNGQLGTTVTHEQIIGALGRVEGLLEAEIQARRDFRDSVADNFQALDRRVGAISIELQQVSHRQAERPAGAIAAIAQLFERQPLLSVVFAVVILGLGSGGVISIYEAFAK